MVVEVSGDVLDARVIGRDGAEGGGGSPGCSHALDGGAWLLLLEEFGLQLHYQDMLEPSVV